MIFIESKRRKIDRIKKEHSNAIILDVTSTSDDEETKILSPFYPHCGIPVPYSEGITASCVEAVWQGLKVFQYFDVDIKIFKNTSMKNLKRTTRKYGHILGHRKGVFGKELLDYKDARRMIYLPTYHWVLENKVSSIINRLREESCIKDIVLLDYTTNCNPFDTKKPLSHAFLIKAYVEGCYPDMSISEEKKTTNIQLSLW